MRLIRFWETIQKGANTTSLVLLFRAREVPDSKGGAEIFPILRRDSREWASEIFSKIFLRVLEEAGTKGGRAGVRTLLSTLKCLLRNPFSEESGASSWKKSPR